MERPIVAISLGDMAGIGPEIVAKLLARPETCERCRPLILGDPAALVRAGELIGHALEARVIARPAEAAWRPGTIEVIQPEGVALGEARIGEVSAAMGWAAARCIETAARLGAARTIDAAVFAPMNKQAFHLAGHHAIDEIEFLAELTGNRELFLLGAVSPELWTVAATLHVPFKEVAGLVTREQVCRSIRQLARVLRGVGFAEPRIAVAALNPHAGEGGLLGGEEIEVIAPAIAEAREPRLCLTGPVPADTVFVRARQGEFDGVVCMHHDQANIARKLLATATGATLFMGLPAIYATTAHGTAFDIAGKGVADPGSLAAALNYAIMLSKTAAG